MSDQKLDQYKAEKGQALIQTFEAYVSLKGNNNIIIQLANSAFNTLPVEARRDVLQELGDPSATLNKLSDTVRQLEKGKLSNPAAQNTTR